MPEIITSKGIGKEYIIRHQQDTYLTMRDQMAHGLKNVAKKIINPRTNKHPEKESFWALKDISFTINEGERVGIIGRNGAGKSTLLKILSRITEPTTGQIALKGRVASLLEVGTGFHQELTGRENIFLNGAILGMTKKEINKKFNEIVNFADVEKFLDTPVKRYSSGMYVRLAFAVAAHLEPEILIVDEVLAVGDTQFQKKCIGKMQEVGQSGRTVIFVSHNMSAIKTLCDRCILLDQGRIVSIGKTSTIINKYLSSNRIDADADIDLVKTNLRKNSMDTSRFKFTHFSIRNSKGEPTTHINFKEPFTIHISGKAFDSLKNANIGFNINSALGFPLFNSFSPIKKYPKGEYVLDVKFDQNILAPGFYTIGLGANGDGIVDWIPEVININVEQVSLSGESNDINYDGIVVYPCKWSINK